MRALDPRYSALRDQLDQYGQEYLDALSRKRAKRLIVGAMILAGAVLCLVAGAWIARSNYIITFVNI
jgi:hypothetical protein